MTDERLRELVKLRTQQADYGESAELDEPAVTRMIQQADAFTQNVRAYLKARGFLPSD